MSVYLVDIDGVIIDSHSEWLRLYNKDYDDNLTLEKVTRWNTHEFVKPECGNKIYDYLWKPELYDNAKQIDGALSGVRWLRSIGHRVIFLTSGIQPAKIEWLYRNGFLLGEYWQSDKDVIIASDKSVINGNCLIDDRTENCQNFHGHSILFAQPWNADASELRADGWAGVVSHITSNARNW